jgi:hypothetical protein
MWPCEIAEAENRKKVSERNLKNHGHIVLRLPRYHSDLKTMEINVVSVDEI